MGNHDAEARRKLLKQGKAMPNPDGPPKFPIDDASDLDSAIHLARTDQERAFVYKRAKEMNMLGKIPTSWNADGSMRATSGS